MGLSFGLVASGAAAGDQGQQSEGPEVNGTAETHEIQFRGRIVCLAEEMHRLYRTSLPASHEHLYGFRTNEGIYYTLLRTRTSEAFFADKRLHERELIVRGRLLPKTHILDAIPVGSVRDGQVYDLYYYCTVCAIKTVIPGPCMCCQDEVEFVEKPAGE
ncbi:MAG: hypothetical protein HY735_16910 [Verrucomicrobia bacterium]|nr:hypothetical protein [Verrucomicrobiota bacterium]